MADTTTNMQLRVPSRDGSDTADLANIIADLGDDVDENALPVTGGALTGTLLISAAGAYYYSRSTTNNTGYRFGADTTGFVVQRVDVSNTFMWDVLRADAGSNTVDFYGLVRFEDPPEVPTPTLAGHAASKDYVDSRVKAGFVSIASFSGLVTSAIPLGAPPSGFTSWSVTVNAQYVSNGEGIVNQPFEAWVEGTNLFLSVAAAYEDDVTGAFWQAVAY